jgi:hypothetical protein
MTAPELYRLEKARSQSRTAPLIAEARETFERIYPPVIRPNYAQANAAYYQANKARIDARKRARVARLRALGAA